MKTTFLSFFIVALLSGCSTGVTKDNAAAGKVNDSSKIADNTSTGIKNIGPIKVIIANNARSYFLKNKTDTVEMSAKNLSITNKVIFAQNAKIQGIGKDKYLLTPLNNSHSVKIIFGLKKHPDDMVDMTYTPIDSMEVEIK